MVVSLIFLFLWFSFSHFLFVSCTVRWVDTPGTVNVWIGDPGLMNWSYAIDETSAVDLIRWNNANNDLMMEKRVDEPAIPTTGYEGKVEHFGSAGMRILKVDVVGSNFFSCSIFPNDSAPLILEKTLFAGYYQTFKIVNEKNQEVYQLKTSDSTKVFLNTTLGTDVTVTVFTKLSTDASFTEKGQCTSTECQIDVTPNYSDKLSKRSELHIKAVHKHPDLADKSETVALLILVQKCEKELPHNWGKFVAVIKGPIILLLAVVFGILVILNNCSSGIVFGKEGCLPWRRMHDLGWKGLTIAAVFAINGIVDILIGVLACNPVKIGVAVIILNILIAVIVIAVFSQLDKICKNEWAIFRARK